MHVESGILNICFSFALFSLLIYKIRSFVRSHFIPYLIHQKLALKRRYTEVIERKKLVAATMVRVDSQIKNQQMEFVFLEKKIKTWHDYLNRIRDDGDRERGQLLERLKEKRAYQHHVLSQSKIAQEAIGNACDVACKQLEQRYEGQAGKSLLSSYIHNLSMKK